MSHKNQSHVWFDGRLRKSKDVSVQLLNHSLHYGSAAFEGIRCYDTPQGPAIFRLRDHVRRLFHSARVMGMKVPYRQTEISDAIRKTVKKNNVKECYIRPIIMYGARMGLLPNDNTIHVAIAVWPWGKYIENDEAVVHIVKTQRIHPQSGVMTAKISGVYFNSILAGIEAKKAGADEALLLDHQGYIAEGPGENIFFVKGKTLYTPKTNSILPGITRSTIMQLATEAGYQVRELNIKPMDLEKYDEAFFVGTAVEVHPIAHIDRHSFRSTERGSVSTQMKQMYEDVVHGTTQKHSSWRSSVN